MLTTQQAICSGKPKATITTLACKLANPDLQSAASTNHAPDAIAQVGRPLARCPGLRASHKPIRSQHERSHSLWCSIQHPTILQRLCVEHLSASMHAPFSEAMLTCPHIDVSSVSAARLPCQYSICYTCPRSRLPWVLGKVLQRSWAKAGAHVAIIASCWARCH